MMMWLRGLVEALVDLAAAVDRYTAWSREKAALDTSEQQEQHEVMRAVGEINQRAINQRTEWEAVEREHMKVCEKRYRALAEGRIDKGDAIRH